MILDALLELADGQSSTLNVASTNVVDTLAGGDAYAGGMGGLFFVVRVATAFAIGAGTSTATFELQTADTENFSGTSATTLVQSADYVDGSGLSEGTLIALPIPAGAKRYIRGYKKVTAHSSTNRFSAGAWDMYITKDAPITRELA